MGGCGLGGGDVGRQGGGCLPMANIHAAAGTKSLHSSVLKGGQKSTDPTVKSTPPTCTTCGAAAVRGGGGGSRAGASWEGRRCRRG